MMIERIEPKKIYIYAVVPYTDWTNELPNQYDGYASEFDYWSDIDYQVFGIVVNNQLIFLNDNIHDRPNDFFEGCYQALKCYFPIGYIRDVLYLDKGIYERDKTAVQEAIYNKWKSEN